MSLSPAKPQSGRMKQRRSIDLEFHDLLELDDSAHYSTLSGVPREWTHNPSNNNNNINVNPNRPQHKFPNHIVNNNNNQDSKGQLSLGSDLSDGDSFGEASVNSQPDQQYLHELLDDEFHPERVNLLDNTEKPTKDDDSSSAAPRLKTKNGIKIRNYSDHDDDDVSISSVDETENDVGSKFDGSSKSSWNSSWWSESAGEPLDDLNHIDSPSSDKGTASEAAGPTRSTLNDLPEQRIPRTQKIRHLQLDADDDDDDNDESDTESIDQTKGELQKGGTDEESAPEYSDGNGADEDLDNFQDSPTRKPSSFSSRGSRGSRTRPKMLKDSLQNMGKSTKKSLRTINGKTFWSQPFKGLASRTRRAKKGTVSAPTSPTDSPS